MNKYDLKHYRQIKVKFLPVTEHKGARIKIWESRFSNTQRTISKTFSYDYEIDDVLDQAIHLLQRNGWKPVGRATEREYYTILCDAYGDNFPSITKLK